jgi:hypothetical protein
LLINAEEKFQQYFYLVGISLHGGFLVSVDETAAVAAIKGGPVQHDGIFDIVTGVTHHSHDGILT